MSPFWFIAAWVDGSGGDNWSYKTCKAPVKSSPSTLKIFTGRMTFLSPIQQCQSTEWKSSDIRNKFKSFMTKDLFGFTMS